MKIESREVTISSLSQRYDIPIEKIKGLYRVLEKLNTSEREVLIDIIYMLSLEEGYSAYTLHNKT